MVVYISGIPGSGKSTVGKRVAEELGWQFCDVDDLVTDEISESVKKNDIISEADYKDLIENTFFPELARLETNGPVVTAGILLRAGYAALLEEYVTEVLHIYLAVPYNELKRRVTERTHFANVNTMEYCWQHRDKFYTDGIQIDASNDVDVVVSDVVQVIKTPQDI